MAAEEPQVWFYIELGDDMAEVGIAAVRGNRSDAIHHQHIGQRQAAIAGAEHFTMAAGQEFFAGVTVLTHEFSGWVPKGFGGIRRCCHRGHGVQARHRVAVSSRAP